MYVNKSVHMYIYIYIYIYMHPHTHKCGHVCICMEKKKKKKKIWYSILLYMIMNMFTIKISKVIWKIYDDRKGK